MRRMKVEVGAVVLYLPEQEFFAPEETTGPWAALITGIRSDGKVDLTAFPRGYSAICYSAVEFSEDLKERCWSWQPFELTDII